MYDIKERLYHGKAKAGFAGLTIIWSTLINQTVKLSLVYYVHALIKLVIIATARIQRRIHEELVFVQLE